MAWELGRGWKNFEKHDRTCLDCLEQTVNINMDIKDSASEGSEEVRSMAEKMQVISENFQIIMHRQ